MPVRLGWWWQCHDRQHQESAGGVQLQGLCVKCYAKHRSLLCSCHLPLSVTSFSVSATFLLAKQLQKTLEDSRRSGRRENKKIESDFLPR